MYTRTFIHSIRKGFWYLPAFYSVFSLILAYASVRFDIYLDKQGAQSYLPRFMVTDRETTQIILSALATSILTMTAITFSSIMVLLSTYLSQYSPRTLNNFISDMVTRRVLGIFVGSFLYFVLVMLWMNMADQKVFMLVPIMSVSISALCLGFFVYFIHHVGTWIQVSNLIQDITDNCLAILKSRKEGHAQLTSSSTSPWSDWESEEYKLNAHQLVVSNRSGFIQFIDIDSIVKHAHKDDLLIRMERNIGDYVDKGTPLFSYWSLGDRVYKVEDYRKQFRIGGQRTTEQDIEFGIQKLTEIALRAISPGINDPQTAINCIQRLGKVLSRLAEESIEEPYIFDQDKNLRVVLRSHTFSHVLYKTFYQIRFYARQDVSVLASIIEALTLIAEKSESKLQDTIWNFAKAVGEGIDRTSLIELDHQYLNGKMEELAKNTGHTKENFRL
ncbi:DUF2254 domain-containing protein [Pseudalkalibacillus berkeleyi]|uniref:DUF2254 domain-containing protein n=1 Tax=Pseudalkalibacillus berkeleyi TaxID=1069813 RepID=A0ABS9GXD4_9BACL|nr:DUF2254 domain-containing protein [Pseudalkalibacillus berkeleyi]MCF6136265.1 DUF2254 domain-containing protein [Pseudalkalibacillus berkeleyi]